MYRKVINGKMYDTATAEKIAEDISEMQDAGHVDFCEITLYKTGKGAWFRVTYGWVQDGVRSRNEGWRFHRNEFRVLSDDEAREFLEKHSDAETIEAHFHVEEG